jgi:hypothetical protein
MNVPVKIEQRDGLFRASIPGISEVHAEAVSVDQVVTAVSEQLRKRVETGELVFINVGMIGISGLAGKYRNDPALREICEEAYRQRDAEKEVMYKPDKTKPRKARKESKTNQAIKTHNPEPKQGEGRAKGYVKGDTPTFDRLPSKFKGHKPGAEIDNEWVTGTLATDSTTNRVKINGFKLGAIVRAISRMGYTTQQIVTAITTVFGVPIRPSYASSAVNDPKKAKGEVAVLTGEQRAQIRNAIETATKGDALEEK